MGLILLGRAAFVFPLSALSNYSTQSPGARISIRQMIITWWAGLMRRAVSIALAFNQFTNVDDGVWQFESTFDCLLIYLPHHRVLHSEDSLSPKASEGDSAEGEPGAVVQGLSGARRACGAPPPPAHGELLDQLGHLL